MKKKLLSIILLISAVQVSAMNTVGKFTAKNVGRQVAHYTTNYRNQSLRHRAKRDAQAIKYHQDKAHKYLNKTQQSVPHQNFHKQSASPSSINLHHIEDAIIAEAYCQTFLNGPQSVQKAINAATFAGAITGYLATFISQNTVNADHEIVTELLYRSSHY